MYQLISAECEMYKTQIGLTEMDAANFFKQENRWWQVQSFNVRLSTR